MKDKSLIFIISGPSGCGKGTIVNELLKVDPNLFVSVSATTRQPREGEENGVHYHFLSQQEFEDLANHDGFLEYAGYCENRYGTPSKPVQDAIAAGRNVVLEIEVMGALQVKAKCPEAILMFILPPSMKELERRLRKRGTETEEKIQKRLAKVQEEKNYIGLYDYVVVNDALEDAVQDVLAIFRAEHRKQKNTLEIPV